MKSIGKIIYNPYTHLASSSKWAVLMADNEIGKYYRHLYYREFPYKGKLISPVWSAHISFIRNETILNKDQWKIDNNKIIEFEYEPGVLDNGEYFWLKAHCPYLLDLREELGLIREPKFGLHLTIGRTK